MAASKGRDEVLGLLLEAGADIDDVDQNGQNAMTIAAQNEGTQYKTGGALFLLNEWSKNDRQKRSSKKRKQKQRKKNKKRSDL